MIKIVSPFELLYSKCTTPAKTTPQYCCATLLLSVQVATINKVLYEQPCCICRIENGVMFSRRFMKVKAVSSTVGHLYNPDWLWI